MRRVPGCRVRRRGLLCLLFLALTLGVVQLVLYSSVVDRTKLLSGDVLRLGAALERENQPANSVYGPKRDVTERRDDDVTERPDDDVTGTRHDDVTLDSMNDRVDAAFPPLDGRHVAATLHQITALLEPSYRLMEQYAEQFEVMDPRRVQNVTAVTSVINEDYAHDFRKLETEWQLRTVFLRIPRAAIGQLLPNESFHYSANTCEPGAPRRHPGELMRFYGAECGSLETAAATPRSLPVGSVFSVGLPRGFRPVIDSSDRVTAGFLHVIHRAVIGRDGDVYVRDKKIVPLRCHPDVTPAAPRVDATTPRLDAVFSVGLDRKWQEFYHVTLEQLPRAAPFIPWLRRRADVYVHVAEKRPYLVALLALLGVAETRLVTGTVAASLVFRPAGVKCSYPSFFNLQLVSLHFRSLVPERPRNWVIVVRRSQRRWFHHHDDIVRMIQSETRSSDVTVHMFDDRKLPSPLETVAMFSRAFLVVAPHGAGLANLLFSEPGTAVVEGSCLTRDGWFSDYLPALLPLVGRLHVHYPPPRGDSCRNIRAGELRPAIRRFVKLYNRGVHRLQRSALEDSWN